MEFGLGIDYIYFISRGAWILGVEAYRACVYRVIPNGGNIYGLVWIAFS